MQQNIIPVDLDKIDIAIRETALHLEMLSTMKKYILSMANQNSTPVAPKKDKEGKKMKISEFLLYFLGEHGKSDAKVITQAYADYINSSYEDESGNVSNALSRLKTAGKIGNEERPGGKKAGYLWFLITKN